MFHHDALRQLTEEHRLHREAEAEAERLALEARGGRVRLARRLTAQRHATQRAGHVVVSVWPRR